MDSKGILGRSLSLRTPQISTGNLWVVVLLALRTIIRLEMVRKAFADFVVDFQCAARD